MTTPQREGDRRRVAWFLALVVGMAVLWVLALMAAHAPTCARTSGHDWIPCLDFTGQS